MESRLIVNFAQERHSDAPARNILSSKRMVGGLGAAAKMREIIGPLQVEFPHAAAVIL
jgi:hypothetical protein